MRGLRRLRARDDSGATLIEMVVALMIFAIVSTALLALMMTSIRLTAAAKARTAAANIAASVVDEARAAGPFGVPLGRTTTVRSVSGRDYTVDQDAQFVARSRASSCDNPDEPTYVRMRVVVSWDGMGAIVPVETGTIVARQNGDVDALGPTKRVAVRIHDEKGKPVTGVKVSLVPGDLAPQRTTADGCAFFPFVPLGTYDVKIHKSGHVDRAGRTEPSSPLNLISGGPTAEILQFTYDRAVTLRFVAAPALADYPAPGDLPITLTSPSLEENESKTRPLSGTWPLEVQDLFPYSLGYEFWAGSCTDDPGKQRGTRQPAAARPGSQVESVVSLGPFEVRRSSLPADGAGWTVTAARAANAVEACTDPVSYTFTPSQDGVVRGSLPFGTWTFTAVDATGALLTTEARLDPGTAGPVEVKLGEPEQ